MEQTKKILEKLISQKDGIVRKELDDLFMELDSVAMDEIRGLWKIEYLFTKERVSGLETLSRCCSIFRLYGKKFLSEKNVKAWIYSILGIKFSIPGTTATLKMMKYRDKNSTAMVYNHLPITDYFRKVDDSTILAIMEMNGKVSLYFCLKKKL